MAAETKSPDVLITQTNLTGTVSAIQDDPDTPDANWLTYITNNVNTVCRVSFPTPTGNPTVGADLQNFKIWVRKQPGTGTPTVAISLYENGSLISEIMTATNVTSSTGQLFSATWNASSLGTADGSLAECYISGIAVGGAPATRCTVEVGAVEWNVTYDSTVNASVTPSALPLTATQQTPIENYDYKLTSPLQALSLAQQSPIQNYDYALAVSVLGLTGLLKAPTQNYDYQLSVLTQVLSLLQKTPTQNYDYQLGISNLNLSLSQIDPAISLSSIISLSALGLSVTLQSPTLTYDYLYNLSAIALSCGLLEPVINTITCQDCTIIIGGSGQYTTIELQPLRLRTSIKSPNVNY